MRYLSALRRLRNGVNPPKRQVKHALETILYTGEVFNYR